MSRRGELDAIVVGGGAIGAALALALARDAFDVALVEARAPKPWRAEDDVDLRVVALAADARKLFEALGVWPMIEAARIGPYRRMHVRDGVAPGALTFDSAENGEAALGWIIENRLIQHALWSAVEAERNARVVCPGEVASIVGEGDGVEAVLADGTRLRARVAIAADGAESPVRAMLGIEANGRDYLQRGIVANVTTARSHEHTAWQRFLPTGPLAFLPLADGRCSIVWTLPDAEAARVLALDDDAFRAELGAAFDFRLGEIVATTARAAFPLRLRLADRYVSGRVVLAGDAAHVVHPLAGQGVNLGLRDAMELADILVDAKACGREFAADHVLRRYDRRRRSDDTLSAHAFDAIQRVFGSGSPVLATLRGAGLALVDRIGPLKRAFARHAAGR